MVEARASWGRKERSKESGVRSKELALPSADGLIERGVTWRAWEGGSVCATGPSLARLHRVPLGAQVINLPHNAFGGEVGIVCGALLILEGTGSNG